ncbi:nuclear transport factor 2 family protein [Amycolatopsis taiwanensis]|uniref:nuclear transport factor 2 family protein n=1 Tax=Amycolatopsis taiwanensis TaxID=342230 RepID=UPI0004ADBECE|nr:nuclear transport factor 2 family protein [Amycolatopsis taiwanensis]
MVEETIADVSAETLVRVHQLYGAQSHLIDNGHARAWARTFTADGEFHSPTYPEPVVGIDALTRFAEDFARQDGITRHVITNVFVVPVGPDALTVHAYLQIVHTPAGGPSRLARQTTITDELVRDSGTWRIRRRTVRRDDENHHGTESS